MKILIILFSLLFINGCTIQLVSQYDEKTDSAITSIHKEISDFLVDQPLPDPPGETPEAITFYKTTHSHIKELKLRANAIPNNDLTLQQIDLLDQDITLLENLDKLGHTAIAHKLAQDAIDIACGAMLKLELAKKRGQ